MGVVEVTIKWSKQKFPAIEIDTEEEDQLELLRAQVYSLTKVPVDRQKLLHKGKMLKTDADLQKLKAKALVMVMGTAEVLKEPAEKVVFEEDLTDDQKHAMLGAVSGVLGGGLVNLGNTCYMNSSLQMLRQIPELNNALTHFDPDPTTGDQRDKLENQLSMSLGQLFQEQKQKADAVTPYTFTTVFRTLFPQFAERDPQTNNYMQQDAHESLNELLSSVGRKLARSPTAADPSKNWIDYLFQGQMRQITECKQTGEKKEIMEPFKQLSCNITIDINYMYEGVKLSLNEELDAPSAALGTVVPHTRVSKIAVLPRYMVVQFVRFFWKREKNLQCKQLRKVKYPKKYDVMELCDDGLKKKLLNARKLLSQDQERELGLLPATLKGGAKGGKEGEESKEEVKEEMGVIPDDSDTSGNYSLQAIVTHKGRASNGGHYVGWTKKDEKEWYKYDDDVVSTISSDAAMDLSGGGDWHIAYLCLYKREDDMIDRRKKMASKDDAKAEETKPMES